MIAHLRGTVLKSLPGHITVDVNGVGYKVTVPHSVWDELNDNEESHIYIATYVREDRLDLYGFLDSIDRMLFEECTKISGIGPSLALEICGVPSNLLLRAIQEEDADILTNIKGVGKKRAEKMLIELRSILENKPAIFTAAKAMEGVTAQYDQDAIGALTALGYDQATSIQALKNTPKDLKTTEERIKAALQSL